MPAKSVAQQHWAEGCLHNPGKMRGKCPSKAVAEEFTHISHGGKVTKKSDAPKAMPKKPK